MKALLYIILVVVFFTPFTFCKKKADPVPAPVASNPPPTGLNQNTKCYVKYAIGTKTYSYTEPDNGFWSFNSGGVVASGSLPYFYSTWTNLQVSSQFFLCASDSTRESSPVSENFFKNLLKVKDFTYDVKSFNKFGPAGIYLSLKDSISNLATTKPQDTIYPFLEPKPFQQSSNFKIVECIYYVSPGSSYLDCKFKATFNCKLYRTNGDSVNLTNGEIITTLTKF